MREVHDYENVTIDKIIWSYGIYTAIAITTSEPLQSRISSPDLKVIYIFVDAIRPVNVAGQGAYNIWFNLYDEAGKLLRTISPNFVVEISYSS